MALIVQKFGGTSVANPECLRRVADWVLDVRKKGNDVVVIVSAMGDSTDDLISLAHQITPEPDDRELDVLMATGEQVAMALLAMALHAKGADAVSLTGPQAGIRTDAMHRKAKIMAIDTRRIRRHLREGHIVIVAGFQGLTPNHDVATLGRGGSDATAVALAAALPGSVGSLSNPATASKSYVESSAGSPGKILETKSYPSARKALLSSGWEILPESMTATSSLFKLA